jgi:LysR family transcriptional regulator, regulator for genes of the gallate degradation pathway
VALETNLRHLRVLLAVAEQGSVTRAAELCRVSQPAVTQAIAKLERLVGCALFTRGSRGLFATNPGKVLAKRVSRAMAHLDGGTREFSPWLGQRVTYPQLQAVIAVRETENFTLAAARLGIAQPTVHRAISQLEREAGVSLFERTSRGMIASRACEAIATAARLAFYELAQAYTDLAEFAGR